jgi:hypothetical protein
VSADRYDHDSARPGNNVVRTPGLTVGIPVRNGAAYLPNCLESLYAESFDDLEILVIDDASTDGSVDLIRRLQKPNVRLLQNDRRLGIAGTTNRLVQEARSRWVKFLYQDDQLAAACLTEFAPAMVDDGPGIVVCERRYQFEQGIDDARRAACETLIEESIHHRFRDEATVGQADVLDLVLRSGAISNVIGEPVATAVRRRDYLAAGYAAWLRIGLRTGIALVHRPLATFRVHADSETARNLTPERQYATAFLDPLGLWLGLARDALANPAIPSSLQRELLGRIKGAARDAAEATMTPARSGRHAAELAMFLLRFRRELARCLPYARSSARPAR